MAANASKYMVFGSMGASGLVALAALLDLILGVPFARHVLMDILFLVAAAMIVYMGYDAYKDLR